MTRLQSAAFVMSQSVAMQAELESMKAHNAERERNNSGPAYGPSDFANLATVFGLTVNAVCALFSEAEE